MAFSTLNLKHPEYEVIKQAPVGFSWTIFFFVIQIRAFFGLSGLKISYFSIIGFISIVLGYVAMYYLELPSHTFL